MFSQKCTQEKNLETFQMSDIPPQKADDSFNLDLIPESVNSAAEWPLEGIVHEMPDDIVRDFDQWFDSFPTEKDDTTMESIYTHDLKIGLVPEE